MSKLTGQDTLICTAPSISAEDFRDLIDDVPIINQGNLPITDSIYWIPVAFHVFLKDDGTNGFTGSNATTEIDVDEMINSLNSEFQDVGFYFYKQGETNYIYEDWLTNNPGPNGHHYSYVSNALNVIVRLTSGGFALFPWSDSPNNFLRIGHAPAQSSSSHRTFIHEAGHTFGLLHTFLAPQIFDWDVLTVSDYIDHPYNGQYPRELAIRDTISGLNFPYPNCETAGDLICDTPPDCIVNPNDYEYWWPDSTCNNTPFSCTNGCTTSSFLYTGTYEDYNEDYIDPLLDNYMAYHSWNGAYSFTEDQNLRALFYYDSSRQIQYDTSFEISIIDSVEFEGTDYPLMDVTIQTYFPNDTMNYFNATSDTIGWFQGVLFDSDLSANVFKLGSGDFLEYTYDDWREGVSTLDLLALKKHILQIETLNGYKLIAADVNASGTVGTSDAVPISKLILGLIEEFPEHPGPWRFIPEYIPFEEETQFHADPFNMEIDGEDYEDEAPYIESDWVFELSDGLNGHAGFDGVKLGDLNGTNGDDANPQDSLVAEYDNPTFLTDSIYLFEFELTATDSILGWQLGFSYDFNYLEFLEIDSFYLPSFTITENSNIDDIKGLVRINWYDDNLSGLDCDNGKVLFVLKFKALNTFSTLSEYLEMDNGLLRNEAYNTSYETTTGTIDVNAVQQVEKRSIENESNALPEANPVVRVFPNPTSGELTIVFESEFDQQVEINAVDIYGKQYVVGRLGSVKGESVYHISLPNDLPTGVYLFRFNGNEWQYTTRVSVMK